MTTMRRALRLPFRVSHAGRALLARFIVRRRVRVYVLTIALLITLLVGASRVYLGVHYPADGWTAGLAWALACWLVARYLQRRGKIEPPS